MGFTIVDQYLSKCS